MTDYCRDGRSATSCARPGSLRKAPDSGPRPTVAIGQRSGGILSGWSNGSSSQ